MKINVFKIATPEQEEKLRSMREQVTGLFAKNNVSLNEALTVLVQICAISVAVSSEDPEDHIEILKKFLSKTYEETKECLKK